MPEIKIKIDISTREKLKQQAKEDDRSLAKYLERGLKYLADIPGGYHTQTTTTDSTNIVDLSSLPEGTTIKTKKARVLTPEEERTNRYNRFQTLAKQILGHIVTEIEDYRIMDYNSNSLYYSKEVEEPIREGSSVKCVYIYNLPEEKQIEYLEELKHYEKKDRGLTRLQSFSNY